MSNRNWPLGRALVAALLVVGALRADDRITWTELPAAKVLTRFPPGVVYEAGAWKGWYDVTKLGNVSTTQWGEVNDWGYCWAFSAVNMAAWWLDRYRAAGGEVNATLSPTADTYLNGTSKYGYQAALADAIPDYWEPKGGNSANCLSWLFTGEAIEYTGDSLAKLRVKPSGGFFRELIPESAVPDFSCYFRRELEVSDFTPWGTDEESVLFYFSDILFQMLARGPAAVEIPNHAFTLWGAEFKEATYNGATRWKVTKVYVADNDRGETEGTAPQLLSLDVTVTKPPMLSTKTPTITGYKASAYIYRLVPLYGYEADGLPDPEPDPEPEPTPDPEPEPTPDPEPGAPIVPPADEPIADEDLSSHYTYEIHRSYWAARQRALAQGKLLFVLSGADWCSWCSRVKNYLNAKPGFGDRFVVYYVSEASAAQSPYFRGSLPQYGTLDPRTANPFAGTLQPDGSRNWRGVWAAADEAGFFFVRQGYDTKAIDQAITAALEKFPNGLPIAGVTFSLEGPETLIEGVGAEFRLVATYTDGVRLTLDHRVGWDLLSGAATLEQTGRVVAETGAQRVTLRATSYHDYPGTAVERSVAVKPLDVAELRISITELNLEDAPTPQIPCEATFRDGTVAAVLPTGWQVTLVEGSVRPSEGFGYGYEIKPTISAEGVLSYADTSITNHRIRLTATLGELSASQEVTVYGPTQMIPAKVTLLSSPRVAPGSVVRLQCSEVRYNYGAATHTTSELGQTRFWVSLSSGINSTYNSDCTVAVPITHNAADTTSESVSLYGGKANGVYTGWEMDGSQTQRLTLLPAGETLSGDYAGLNTGWLEAYFPNTTHNAAQAEADPDGDGYLNWQEFLLGTEPTKADDAFAFTSQHFEAMATAAPINLYYKVMFTMRSGREYTLQAKEAWGDEWQSVGLIDADKRTSPTLYDAALADRANFFRVVVGYSYESGGQSVSKQTFIPEGLAIAPNALLELDGTKPLALTALAMDDYAPGTPRIRLPEGLPADTVILSAPKHCQRWMECFAPEAPERYAFSVREVGTRLELVANPAANPRPRPPEGDTGAFHPEVRDHLSTVAREAGFAQDFAVRLRQGGGTPREPKTEEVNDLLRCFNNLAVVPDVESNTLTVHVDFAIDTLRFVTVEDAPYLVFGARVASEPPAGRAVSAPVDFAPEARLSLHARAAMDQSPAELSGAEPVTDETGATLGACLTPGRRYFRVPLTAAGSTAFFTLQVSRPE